VASDVQAGSDGARQPQGLEAMRLALGDPSSGFLRDGAKVVVAFFSDAEDCSDPQQRFSMLVKDAQGNVIDQCAQQAAGDGSAVSSLEPVARYVNFTQVSIAYSHLGLYAFFTMVIFGSMYYIVPRLIGREWRYASLIKLHFWASAYGIGLMTLMLLAGGFLQVVGDAVRVVADQVQTL